MIGDLVFFRWRYPLPQASYHVDWQPRCTYDKPYLIEKICVNLRSIQVIAEKNETEPI